MDYVGGRKSEDSFVRKLDEAVEKAKQNREWRHEYMTLLMRDHENIEKGIEKGKIYGAISTYRELEIPEHDILGRLQGKFRSTEGEAREYLQTGV